MTYSGIFLMTIEIIGTIAFAFSGALMGIRKQFDLFGVIVLGVVTAMGGGLTRDIILNLHPPKLFRSPLYVLLAVATAVFLFVLIYVKRDLLQFLTEDKQFDRIMGASDSIGLGIFTVTGIQTAINMLFSGNLFLMVFVGVITGVGGGLLRDIMAQEKPYIFVKHIYACASIAGGVLYVLLLKIMPVSPAMIIAACFIFVLRSLAAHYKWNLPRIR